MPYRSSLLDSRHAPLRNTSGRPTGGGCSRRNGGLGPACPEAVGGSATSVGGGARPNDETDILGCGGVGVGRGGG